MLEETPAPKVGAQEEAQETAAETQAAKPPEERIAELEARLTQRGRSEKQVQAELSALKAEREQAAAALADAAKVNSDWKKWYIEHAASEEEKSQYALEQKATELSSGQKAVLESNHWKSIAKEDNPTVKRALIASAEAGEFLGKAAIEALRTVLAPSPKDEAEETEEKGPPKVSATGGTRGTEPSIDQQIAQVTSEIKKGNANYNVGDLLPLMQKKQELERAARG